MHPPSHSDDDLIDTPASTTSAIQPNPSSHLKNSGTTDAVNKRKISHSAIEKRRRERINIKVSIPLVG